eukprot:TRINITY_DN431_c0_g2_i1.p1 TRINITY_DN431_c0_g2~~TRINITY_DN431_c0_g2_i1.p1  ORF type:complete len:371 (+),score=83.21 TRINITY_DN431_c0_g2_i1:22-1113(+)
MSSSSSTCTRFSEDFSPLLRENGGSGLMKGYIAVNGDLVHDDKQHIPPLTSGNGVIIRVMSCALNRMDLLQRAGKYAVPAGESSILGVEVAGVVVAIRSVREGGAHKFALGDRVMALLAGGGYAEFVSAQDEVVNVMPEGMSFNNAAAIPEAFMTAYAALFWSAPFKDTTESVLIHAGASGVGLALIQLVKRTNADIKIIVTAGSQEKLDYCKSQGAHVGINYKTDAIFSTLVKEATDGRGVDVVIDFVGASYFAENLESLAMEGRMTMLGFLGGAMLSDGLLLAPFLRKRLTVVGSTLRTRSLDYKERLVSEFSSKFLRDFTSGDVSANVWRVYDWAKADEAQSAMQQNQNLGKIVLTVVAE